MSYTPTEWEPTDVVTATRMNALETAVGDMNMSYTPNTWSDGDILSAEKMNALEQAVASGGGGGSSDFSTAQVTVVNNTNDNVLCYAPVILESPAPIIPSSALGYFSVSENSSTAETLIMYKGEGDMTIETEASLSGSGDVEIDSNNAYITGDCTITIS